MTTTTTSVNLYIFNSIKSNISSFLKGKIQISQSWRINMNCFRCFSTHKCKKKNNKKDHDELDRPREIGTDANKDEQAQISAQKFSFRELATATKNFRQERLLGEGGFGRVYKGTLKPNGQVVAVKQLDRNTMKENKEFLVEVARLSVLQHENLVHLIGYCADGDQRILVYEFMPKGSLRDNLFASKGDDGPQMGWLIRMKIAYGVAQALEYLHDKTNPPVIYRDLKSSNVLLDEDYNPKLSDIGLDKFGHSTEKTTMQSRGMGTYGYSAPEYQRSGKLTTVADVYSFGVILLELITGRKAVDTCKSASEQNLVTWAQPIFKEPKRFPDMTDPVLKNQFPVRGLNQAVAIAAMCLQDEVSVRPLMSDVVTVLSYLSTASKENEIPPSLPPSMSSRLHSISDMLSQECGSNRGRDPSLPPSRSSRLHFISDKLSQECGSNRGRDREAEVEVEDIQAI